MKEKLTVHICEGCKKQFEEEYGETLGFLPGVEVKIVPQQECDYLEMPDGRMQFEWKEDEKFKLRLRELHSGCGVLYIEKIGQQEEEERIKIYDSNLHYLDYFSVESIEETAKADDISFEEEYEKFISYLEKCQTVDDILDELGINWEIKSKDTKDIANVLVDYNTDDDGPLDNNEYVAKIGEYYILLAD